MSVAHLLTVHVNNICFEYLVIELEVILLGQSATTISTLWFNIALYTKLVILNNISNFILKLPEILVLSCLCVFLGFAIANQLQAVGGEDEDDEHAPFMRKPFCVYRGHTADLLDLSWSKARTYLDDDKRIKNILTRVSRLLN